MIGSVGDYVGEIRPSFQMISRLLVQLTPDGRLDASFGKDGVVSQVGLDALSAVVAHGGELLVSGRHASGRRELPTEAVVRLRPDGSLDRSFGHSGRSPNLFVPPLSGIAVDHFGRSVVLGGRGVLRLTRHGLRDRRFGLRGNATVRLPGDSTLNAVAIQRSGRILLAGTQVIAKQRSETTIRSHRYRRSFTVIGLNGHGRPDRRFGHHAWVATRFGRHSSAQAAGAFIDRSGCLVIGGTIARPDLAPTGGVALTRYRLGR